MDLFRMLPALRHHPLLQGKSVTLVGVSTIVCDEAACYFELTKPKYWRKHPGGGTTIGVGGVGGRIESGESLAACLRREVEEELGAHIRLRPSEQTYLMVDWEIADTMHLPPSRKRPAPLMVILVPPQLGGAEMPDHLAISVFHTHLAEEPMALDLFGLLRVERQALAEFFARDEWKFEGVEQHPAFAVTLNGPLPEGPVLRPVLTARAFQSIVRADRLDEIPL
jgi:8-oxo-dGTP pyrophosphatase MutT (NUDIX family)